VNGIIPVERRIAIAELQRRGFPADDWRVVNQNGRWWFWAPEESWLYFNNNQWVTYPAPEQQLQQELVAGKSIELPAGYPPDEWRLMFHRGHWWFWTPSERWLYFRNGSWNQYPLSPRIATRESTEDPHAVGFRGNLDSQGAPEVASPDIRNDEVPMRAPVETED
jgi:hypothetical protein